MRITAAVDLTGDSGKDYWRMQMPLNHLGKYHGCTIKVLPHFDHDNLTLPDGNTIRLEDVLHETDLIVIGQGYVSANFSARVKYLKSFCPVILDIDDYWRLPDTHPMQKMYLKNKIGEWTEMKLRTVDAVTTTNEYLAELIYPFNHNVYVLPNAIDPDNDQFDNNRATADNITRFGYMGGTNHAADVKLLVEPVKKLYELEKDFQIQLCGFHQDNPDMNYYEYILTNRRKIHPINEPRYKRVGAAMVTDYAKGYNGFDVSLAPLVDNTYNRCKSDLKMIEAANFGIPIITNNPYTYPQLKDGVNGILTKNWLRSLRDCIHDKEMVDALGYSAKQLFKNQTLEHINTNRLEVYKMVTGKSNRPVLRELNGDKLKVFSICYDDKHIADYNRYDNNRRTIEEGSYLFEYNPMIEIMNNHFEMDDYVAILSYRHRLKTGVTPSQLMNLLQQEEQDSDVYGLSPSIYRGNYLKESFKAHPNLDKLIKALCRELKLIVAEPYAVVFSNSFIAKYPIYKEFIETIVKPAIDLMEDNQEIRTMAWKDSQYQNLTKEELKEKTGLDYYPMHTFALERLFSIWLENHPNIKFRQLI